MTEELNYDRIIRSLRKLHDLKAKPLLEILEESRVFKINTAVAESLYAITPRETDFVGVQYLPFNLIFFDIPHELIIHRGCGLERKLKGLTLGKTVDMFPDYMRDKGEYSAHELEIIEQGDNFGVQVWYEDGFDVTLFNLKDIDELKTGKYPVYNPENKDINDKAFVQLCAFCCNLVNYINAHNVTINRRERTDKSAEELERINQKRIRKGKKQLNTLKPYYWIDVRESITHEDESGIGKRMDYRELVRGHFQRYYSSQGTVRNWIQPYVRGPEDASWRETRHRVLADLLAKREKE